jgi:hypothetical protein
MSIFNIILAAATAWFASTAHAQPRDPFAKLGNWFAYGERGNITAMTVKGREGLGIECKAGEVTAGIVLNEKEKARFTGGEMLHVVFRADRLPEIKTIARAQNERFAELMTPHEMVRQIQGAKKVVFRLTGEKTAAMTRDYDVTGAAVVLPEVLKGCPLE